MEGVHTKQLGPYRQSVAVVQLLDNLVSWDIFLLMLR